MLHKSSYQANSKANSLCKDDNRSPEDKNVWAAQQVSEPSLHFKLYLSISSDIVLR